MTINLTDLKAKAEAATPDWAHRTSEADAAYIAAASPAAMLPLINALIEWRDAMNAVSVGIDDESVSLETFEVLMERRADATQALLALITKQETNNDAG